MGIMGITTGQDHLHFGTRSDVCTLCAREKAKEDRTDPITAGNNLRGTYEGKKLLKIPVSGTQVTICVEHIQKLAEQTREDA